MKGIYELDKVKDFIDETINMYITDGLMHYGEENPCENTKDFCDIMANRLKELKKFAEYIRTSKTRGHSFDVDSQNFKDLFYLFRDFLKEYYDFSSLENQLKCYRIWQQITVDAFNSNQFDNKTILRRQLDEIDEHINELCEKIENEEEIEEERAN